MQNNSEENLMEKIISLAKRRGFVFQGSEIYGGLAGTWDWGPLGVSLKKNVKDLWWKKFVESRRDMYGLDAAILMSAKVWEASGHVAGFSDPLVECTKCKRRFREDVLKEKGKCDDCGSPVGEARQFNMMFSTKIGAVEDSSSVSYLRPETAQGIFVNFKNVVDSFHPKLPFGIAQIGKAFRNEITPRDFLFRQREFEQMEVEYFVREADWQKYFAIFKTEMLDWMTSVGIDMTKVHELEVGDGDRAHYSKRTIDFEFDYPFGRKELFGLAYRGSFDLNNHKIEYIDEENAERITPHVIEPSFGVDRAILALLVSAYTEDEKGGEVRPFLKLKPNVAPVICAVSPLLKNKPQLVEKAEEVFGMLKAEFGRVSYDDNGNIGKRYRRQDEIGTPYCIVVDFETLEGDTLGTVTVRDRDTGSQERVKIFRLDFKNQRADVIMFREMFTIENKKKEIPQEGNKINPQSFFALAQQESNSIVIRPEDRDSEGKLLLVSPGGAESHLSEENWKIVRTQSFKKWFGDWQKEGASHSDIVDENGEPALVYHTTNEDLSNFENFSDDKANKIREEKNKKAGVNLVEAGFYFTAGNYVYGENRLSVFVNAKAKEIEKHGDIMNMDNAAVVHFKKQGYTGLIHTFQNTESEINDLKKDYRRKYEPKGMTDKIFFGFNKLLTAGDYIDVLAKKLIEKQSTNPSVVLGKNRLAEIKDETRKLRKVEKDAKSPFFEVCVFGPDQAMIVGKEENYQGTFNQSLS